MLIIIQKSQLKLYLNIPKGKLVDNFKLATDVSGIGTLGNGDYQVIVSDDSNLSNILSLIEQSVNLQTSE